MKSYDAIILAGNPKAFSLKKGEHSYFDLTVSAAQSLKLNKIVVVSDKALSTGQFEAVPAGTTLFQSLSEGMKRCTSEYVLVLATDISYSEETLHTLLEAADKYNAWLYCGIAPLNECRRLKQGIRAHLLTRRGPVRLASVYIIHRETFWQRASLAEALLRNRKSISRICKLLLGYMLRHGYHYIIKREPLAPRFVPCAAILTIDYDSEESHIN